MNIFFPDGKSLNFNSLLRKEWIEDQNLKHVWITGFNMLGVHKNEMSNNPLVSDLGAIRVVIFIGRLRYVEGDISIEGSDPYKLQPISATKTTPEGCYLLMIQRFKTDEVTYIEEEAKKATAIYSGLLSILWGQNAVFRRLFDIVINFRQQKWNAFSPQIREPKSFPKPDISSTRIEFTLSVVDAIERLPEFEKKRVELSLQWYFSGLESMGLDAFLKTWFAVEALGFDERENIEKLNMSLSQAYGISVQDAKTKFQLGKLYGFRNRIVHRGEIYPIELILNVYLEALYSDILFQRLGLFCERNSEKIASHQDFDIDRLTFNKR